MPYEVFFGRKLCWEDLAEQEPQEEEDEYIEFEAKEAAEEEDSFPDLSEINLFDQNPIQLVTTISSSLQSSDLQYSSLQSSTVQSSSLLSTSAKPNLPAQSTSLLPTSTKPIPIDPLLLSSAANADSNELGTETVSLTSIEESVLAAGARARN